MIRATIAFVLTLACATHLQAQQFDVIVAKRDIQSGSVLGESDVQIVKKAADDIPAASFADPAQVFGKTAVQKIFANSPILKTQLSQAKEVGKLPQEMDSQETRIIAIPVGVSTRFEIGEMVQLVDTEGDERRTIAGSLKVFHIGEPEMIEGEDGKKLFMRFVSVLVPLAAAENIANSLDSGEGIFVLEKVNPDARPPATATRPKRQTEMRELPPRTAEAEPVEATARLPEPEVHSTQLRKLARMLEMQAAELEDQGNFEKADLIRQACQNLREAARAK